MLSFLGRLSDAKSRSLYFSGKDGVVVQCHASESGQLIQAFKRLVLAEAHLKKGMPLEQLQTILSTYNSSLEISSSVPDEDWVRRLDPSDGRKRGYLEAALKRVQQDLKREEDAYLDWKGVRDLDEAHYNLSKRQAELFDLNQKLYHVDQEAQFIYHPGHPLRTTPSAHQSVRRFHLRELKDQAKERASAVRLRIDFTKRQRMKDLKEKRKALLNELEVERKRENDHEKTIASIVDSGSAISLSIIVRSKTVLVEGRREPVISACEAEVLDSTLRLRRTLKERLGFAFRDGQTLPLFDSGGQRALVPSKSLSDQVGQIATQVIGSVPMRGKLPEIRFPRFEPGKKFAYLGLALRDDFSRTTLPILYDLDEQGPRHTAVVGGSGSGKSVAASLIVEGAATNRIPVIVFDPTGSWTGLAEPCASKSLLDLYGGFGLVASQSRGFSLRVVVPREDGYKPGILDEALSGSEISIFTSDSMTSAQEASFAAVLLNDLLERMRSWPESKTLKLLLVFEEAHRYLGEKTLEPILEVFARTARARGVGLLIVSQVAVDLPPAVRSNTATKIQLFTNYNQDLGRAAQTFGSEYRKLISRFSKGQGALTYPEFGNAIVAFRPPLHSTAGLSPSTYQIFQSIHELGRLAATLTRHDATSDAIAAVGSEPPGTPALTNLAPEQAVTTPKPATWRDVAAPLIGSGVRASAIYKGIQEAGMIPPSLRTLQRFKATMRPDGRWK